MVYATDMKAEIAAEALGVMRENIPWDIFRSTYLSDFGAKPQQELAVNSVRKVGKGNWEKQLFWGRLRQLLSDETLCDLKLFYGGTKTLPDANKGKEVPSKPDFVLHVGEDSPTWADVDLLFEHTRSQEAVTKKFSQWLRGAWSVFHHQPFRRHLYGIMFIRPRAYVCYADHGCAVYSEPLYFATNIQFLVDFLTWFIANPRDNMRTRGPKSLMRIIRDAMITYYEAYKLPKFGFIHGDISIENILVLIEGCVLTGGLTCEDRCGTLIDWNLCFNAHGASSNRAFESGTPAFMAPVLLNDKQIPRRTLGHDMESFFAVIIWIATFNFLNEAAFRAKPLAVVMLDNKKTPMDIVNAKGNWFKRREDFMEWVTDYFERPYREDMEFLTCVLKLREILYPSDTSDFNTFLFNRLKGKDNKATKDADPMKETLFRECMKEIDDYLQETKGCDEMRWIDSNALARHTPESLMPEENRVD
ncbi:uncharacterized protein Z518_09132 [Rhinocladiella mackenziei CBS 650.93]|uniref:Fungal-type protein kinase domain-containing protein n=1 Tax=Rhinocladiella mackenziei CBS 650.93 TaxID=1442369 RepID=A0A0D2IDS9_9EURO|nr:uncharacterized protein Z518_09132 [Rhinocladiella mackenziei CBS 650.93]KIX01406.1 hypothetical protein Z518_09132 [Rhinocladiella mackenziei CBS 650.93]